MGLLQVKSRQLVHLEQVEQLAPTAERLCVGQQKRGRYPILKRSGDECRRVHR